MVKVSGLVNIFAFVLLIPVALVSSSLDNPVYMALGLLVTGGLGCWGVSRRLRGAYPLMLDCMMIYYVAFASSITTEHHQFPGAFLMLDALMLSAFVMHSWLVIVAQARRKLWVLYSLVHLPLLSFWWMWSKCDIAHIYP